MPSILEQALEKKITWSTAISEIEAWGEKLIGGSPQAQQLVQATISAVKQGASNAIALADTELASHFTAVVTGVETAADAALNGATGGKALPAVPIVNGVIQQIAAAGKAAFDAWALKAQAELTAATKASAPASAEPNAVVQPVEQAA